MADHKYIRREGTRGNYKYIYEEDLKNTRNYYNAHTNTKAGHKVTSGEVQGPPEVSKEYLEAYRANTKKNDYTPHVVPANNTPKPASNQNHTFTLGADGTTVPVKNTPQKKESKNPFAGVGKAVSGFGKGVASSLNSAGKGISSAADKAGKGMTVAANGARRDIKNAGSKLVMGANGAVEKIKDGAKDAAKKQFNKAVNKAFDKAETEYAKKEKDGTFDKLNKALTSKAMTKLTGAMEGAVKNEMGKLTKKNRPPKAEAAETRKSSVKSIENDKATVTGADYLKKAADKGLTKGDEFYDQFAEAGDLKIVGDKDKIKKLDNYFTRQITGYSLAKKANALRKDADDALAKSYDHSDEFDKKCAELESKGARMTKVDMRNYLKDKRFKDLVRLEANGEEVTDEQMYESLSNDPYENIPTEMLKDFDNLLEESYAVAEKEHAARHAEYMANIMDIQNEKNYQKEMKDIEEDDFEWYQNGKRLNDDGKVSASHKVKEKY